MAKITLKTADRVVPMIYAYTTPGISYHDGYIKIGYTEQDVDERIRQQTHTAGILAKKEWQGNAIFDDGSGETFSDKEFHAYLRKNDIKQPMDLGNPYFDPSDRNEWFFTTPRESKSLFHDFRADHGIIKESADVIPYKLRAEQEQAVQNTVEYATSHTKAEFLWNAKPRFGKTLSVYDFCKQYKAQNVLIVTNRPAIANSWYSDYERFLGRQSGYLFVSSTPSLLGKKYVLSRDEYIQIVRKEDWNCIEFVSLQDLKGSKYFGGSYDKLKEISTIEWDVLVIDEAHEGVDTYKTDVAFDRIKRKFTLHLSGTPFKALANEKFPDSAIYNWTYADEQRAKRDWSGMEENPYQNLPKLNLFTYQMSEIIRDELEQGIEIQGETEEYAFDLNEFFAVTNTGRFVHESSVDRFLDAMTTQEKFPFSTPELRNELKHTFWLLNRVESARALARKLEIHPVFKDYKVVLAAGDGKIDDADETQKSYDKVKKAISENEKTITLSVGQLTTGITIPEWSAVLMLSSIRSPALYMQAAFRAQNPCLFVINSQYLRKENAYVFDFDPARTLTIFEEFANDLSAETADGKGDMDQRKKNIRELLNFFPVIGEDENGEMIPLDAEKVLSIPRKIRSQEVVRRGFMSNFLFQNISNIFSAPPAVLEMIQNFPAVKESEPIGITDKTKDDLSLNQDGDVEIPEEQAVGIAQGLFGDKIYGEVVDTVQDIIKQDEQQEKPKDETLEHLKQAFKVNAIDKALEVAQDHYGSDLRPADKKHLQKKLQAEADRKINRAYGNYEIEKKTIEQEAQDLLNICETDEDRAYVQAEMEGKLAAVAEDFQAALSQTITDMVQDAGEDIVKTVETNRKEKEKKTIEDKVRDHLRGFSRTIPSFLMAYGNDDVTLATFDKIVPAPVFKDVTSITLDEFCFLRDGGSYIDENTGEEKHFDGQLFEPVVFDDSVREFMRLKAKLANYFEEKSTEDIFDYIPPQKTFQIFTPKKIVQQMADMLEAENPGCFDNPDKTFIDLYMKSGLYITEIVKRLYRSEHMKQLYPDNAERLEHIFAKQVYGLAPTEIIYRIALSYILGFSDEIQIEKHNLRQADAAPYAQAGNLQELLDQLFPEEEE